MLNKVLAGEATEQEVFNCLDQLIKSGTFDSEVNNAVRNGANKLAAEKYRELHRVVMSCRGANAPRTSNYK